MPYKVRTVLEVEKEGVKATEYTNDPSNFEAGLNRLEEAGYTLKSVLHSGTGNVDDTRLIFFKKPGPSKRRWEL